MNKLALAPALVALASPSFGQVCSPDSFESNDTCAAAAAIPDGTYPGLNVSDGDPDFYSITLDVYEATFVDVTFDSSQGDIDLYLWNPAAGCDSRIQGTNLAVNGALAGSTGPDPDTSFFWNNQGPTSREVILEVRVTLAPGAQCVPYTMQLSRAIGDPGTLGTYFCFANPNSLGEVSTLYLGGSTVAADNMMTVYLDRLPPGQFGMAVVSATAGAPLPVQSGRLCLTGDIGRFSGPSQIFQADQFGLVEFNVDLTALPIPTGFVSASAGDTWYFQAWYRDVLPAGNTSNFTSGIEITFQ